MATSRPFVFRLERVRTLRERAAQEAREQLARGITHRQEGERALASAAGVVADAQASRRQVAGTGATAADLLAAQVWIERAVRERQAAAHDLRRREAEVDERHSRLTEAARAHEGIERLRERQRAAHDLDCSRAEQRELDAMALRRGPGKAA